VACEARLRDAGFTPRFIAPSNTKMANAVTYFDQMVAEDSTCLRYLEEFCYHRYRGFTDTDLQNVANRAAQYGLKTSMLEWWDNGNTYEILHKDLEMGMNSAWQARVIRGHFDVNDSDPQNPVLTITKQIQYMRQYFRYIRPGAVRIRAQSNGAAFAPLAFVNTDGRYTVVVKAAGSGSVSVEDLPAGEYGIRYTTAGANDVALGDQPISVGGSVTANMPGAGVMVVHQKDVASVHSNPRQGMRNPRAPRLRATSDGVCVWSLGTGQSSVAIHDMAGRRIMARQLGSAGSLAWPTGLRPAGVYVVSVGVDGTVLRTVD
jgi:hypothetical protein